MTTPELLTKEEERVWLATYEASLAKDAGIKRSMDVAMEAVCEWRKVAPPGRRGSAEDELRWKLEGAERDRDAHMRRLVETERACEKLREQRDETQRRLESERNSLQEDVAAMKERLHSLEESSAACHQDLAAVRVALGVHNSPDLSVAECVKALTKRVDALRERLATVSKWQHQELSRRNNTASLHQGHWTACDAVTCQADRAALGGSWLTAWDAAHSADE